MLQLERPASWDGTAAANARPCMRRVLPTHVVPPETWTPLPASEPSQLLAAARRSNVQRLQLCLSLSVTPYPENHMAEVELKAEMVASADVGCPSRTALWSVSALTDRLCRRHFSC